MTAADDLTRNITAFGASMVPARDMTLPQAWALVEGYSRDGTIPTLLLPKVRDRKANITGAIVAGVEFRYVKSFNGQTGQVTDSWARPIQGDPTLGLDVRMIVLLVRLARLLRDKHGAGTIYHLGFDSAADDMHRDGRAMDFVGIAGKNSTGTFEINVFSHWKLQPVQMPAAFGTIAAGTKLPDWPENFHETIFRLDPKTNGFLEVKSWYAGGAAELTAAFQMFKAVYDFAAAQGLDRTDNFGTTTIGKDSRNIFHPDYFKVSAPPDKDGRNDHFQHMHFQIGTRHDPQARGNRWLPV